MNAIRYIFILIFVLLAGMYAMSGCVSTPGQRMIVKTKKIKVAVIDTGRPYHLGIPTCESVSFTGDLEDKQGHGSNVAYLIDKNAGNSNYCQISIKFYSPFAEGWQNGANSRKALRFALLKQVDIINYSGGGVDYSSEECELIKEALDKGMIIVAAAGNEQSNLEQNPYYPASCDPRVIVVGCTNLDVANYGSIVDLKYPCVDVGKPKLSGTSQATAIATGRYVKFLEKRRRDESRKRRSR